MDKNQSFMEKIIINNSIIKQLVKVLPQWLSTREYEIIKLRYGLVDEREHTLQEVGIIFGVTCERIRQIQRKALRKIRHPARIGKLLGGNHAK